MNLTRKKNNYQTYSYLKGIKQVCEFLVGTGVSTLPPNRIKKWTQQWSDTFSKCHQTVIPPDILTFENVPLANAIQKRKMDFYTLSTSFSSVFNFIVASCPTTNSIDVRAGNLCTYGHTPSGRTCIKHWTYVQRKIIWENEDFLPQNCHYTAHENCIFARKGALGW